MAAISTIKFTSNLKLRQSTIETINVKSVISAVKLTTELNSVPACS